MMIFYLIELMISYFLKRIKKFVIKKKINHLCDLGSGYGKVLYFFGSLNNYKIDGVELDKEIYLETNEIIETFKFLMKIY